MRECARLSSLEFARPGRPGRATTCGFERAKQRVVRQPMALLFAKALEFRAFTVPDSCLKTREGAPQAAFAVAHGRGKTRVACALESTRIADLAGFEQPAVDQDFEAYQERAAR